MEDKVRLAPIVVSRELRDRIVAYAAANGDMPFAAAVRQLLVKALRQEEGQRG